MKLLKSYLEEVQSKTSNIGIITHRYYDSTREDELFEFKFFKEQ